MELRLTPEELSELASRIPEGFTGRAAMAIQDALLAKLQNMKLAEDQTNLRIPEEQMSLSTREEIKRLECNPPRKAQCPHHPYDEDGVHYSPFVSNPCCLDCFADQILALFAPLVAAKIEAAKVAGEKAGMEKSICPEMTEEVKQCIDFARRVAKAFDASRDSHVFFYLQQAYPENEDWEWSQFQDLITRIKARGLND